jgi:hypothetical protein
MIAQTVTRPMRAAEGMLPTWPVHVTIRVAQGGVLSTSGSLRDWPWFDLGTAAWPTIPSEQKLDKWRPRPQDESWDTAMASTGEAIVSEAAIVLAEDEAMARLDAAATAGDERAFLAAKDAVDWETRPAADFLRAIQLALSAGAHMAARNLAAQGVQRFPHHSELAKYARILAPPRVIRTPARPNAGLRANRDWLMTHGTQYCGQWVALREGQLLGVGDSLDSVITQVGATDGILFTKVC